MPIAADFLFIRLPDGVIKGPFEAHKVVKTHRAGRVPPGSRVSASREGPWRAVADFVRESEGPLEQPLVVSPVIEVPRTAPRVTTAVEPATVSAPPRLAEDRAAIVAPSSTSGPRIPSETYLGLLQDSWRAMTGHYWPVVARTMATLAVAGTLLALPTVVWVVSFLAERYVDLTDRPWIATLLKSTVYIQFIAPLVLVPFGLMFLVCGVLCVQGVVERTDWARWSELFAWRRRLLPMMVLGYVAAGTEIAAFLLTAILFDPKPSNLNILESMLSQCIEACPIVLCLLAGMLVMTTDSPRGAFSRAGQALRWASARLLAARASTLPALATALLIAIICGLLLVPLPFLGLPLLFVSIGRGFRTLEPPVDS